ncbi:MAG: EthD domain-containing protein [Porticoccaceae bacterium]|jgi:uncharacterized protein (TIGR02118 family)|nr:EthD domain-containing protein [Porticoccaceae bacterium]
MFSLVVCVKRRADLSREEFSKHWRHVHGPLIASCPEFTRHLHSYTQYHLADGDGDIAQLFGVSAKDYDGVAVLSFASPEACDAAFKEPQYLEKVRPDEFNFVDTDGCMTFFTEPVFVVKPS